MEYWTPASALVVAAHPDDIEFGCAGTVARWVQEGARVTYVLVTNGAAGEATLAAVIPGSDTRLAYPELLDEGLEPVKLTGVWLMMNMAPNLVVDIGDQIDKKIESLACHVTQIGEDMEESVRFVRGMGEFSAAKEPFQYGEAFRVLRFDLPWEPPRADPGAALGEA